jgi:hypothetical protein
MIFRNPDTIRKDEDGVYRIKSGVYELIEKRAHFWVKNAIISIEKYDHGIEISVFKHCDDDAFSVFYKFVTDEQIEAGGQNRQRET